MKILKKTVRFFLEFYRRVFRIQLVFARKSGVDEFCSGLEFENVSPVVIRSKELLRGELTNRRKEKLPPEYSGRISRGETFAALFNGDDIIGYGWGRFQDEISFSYVENKVPTEFDIFYIYDCYIFSDYRGNRFYSLLINELCKFCGDKDIYIACRSTNSSSIRGIKRSGFVLSKKFVLINLSVIKLRFVLDASYGSRKRQ